MAYDSTPIQAPRAAGALLRALTGLAENPLTSNLLAGTLLESAGIVRLRQVPAEEPLPVEPPVFAVARALAPPEAGRSPAAELALLDAPPPDPPAGSHPFRSSRDFVRAYQEGRTDPVQVAERILAASASADEASPPLRIFIAQQRDDLLRQAEESAARYRAGHACGPLDGVPVAVKDELDVAGYPTTVGTRFLGRQPAPEDATVVGRLRAAGALIIGKTNMHEIGLGVTGVNPHHGACRNPYDPARAPGGSSSGPAAAVAYGLCPLGVGADGGGSIRIPASFCGVVGLKSTFGRLSEHGAAPLCWSLAHVGPIAATAADAALGYLLMAGPDPRDPNSLHQPTPTLAGLDRLDLQGLKLGIYPPWFEHADAPVVAACRRMLDELVQAGAELHEIDLPDLDIARTVHLITIVSEMATAHLRHYAEHRRAYGHDTRLNLVLARRLAATDYDHAQRLRARIWCHFARALEQVELIVSPATGCTAPPIPADVLRTGESNLPLTTKIMRFAQPANLTGLPAISVPVGYDPDGLPIGLQLMARPWQEALLLRVARFTETRCRRQPPRVSCELLG